MDSPEIDGGIDALVEQIGDRLLERLGRPGESGPLEEDEAVWTGSASVLELDLSAVETADAETREAAAEQPGSAASMRCGRTGRVWLQPLRR